MAILSAVPDDVGLAAYGGDTFTFLVRAPTALIAGRAWHGQVRKSRTSGTIDAAFQITEPTEEDGPAFVTLTAAQTAALVGSAPTVRRMIAPGQYAMIAQYVGVWDVQVSPPGAPGTDPTTTLAKGPITVELDVTRVAS